MKTIKELFLVITILFASVSCVNGGSIEGNQKVVNQKREVNSSFTELEVSHGINVYLTQGANHSLEVELDENLHDLLITKVENNILKIYFSENVGRRKRSIVHLSMPLITKLTSSSDAEITSQNQLRVQDLFIISSSSGEIELNIIANKIQCKTSSDGDVNLIGTANLLIVNASSGSDIVAEKLVSQKVEAEASSGSDINVQVVVGLNAIASGGSEIKYWGNPTDLKVDKSSGGKVEKQ
ncbi:MAG: DUF2807 domain-containing protein [Bacteroidales bacterium]|nr:DUF2807 domain-containing protein [Bacteroidales bacterium]